MPILTAPRRQDYPAPNVNSAESEQLRSEAWATAVSPAGTPPHRQCGRMSYQQLRFQRDAFWALSPPQHRLYRPVPIMPPLHHPDPLTFSSEGNESPLYQASVSALHCLWEKRPGDLGTKAEGWRLLSRACAGGDVKVVVTRDPPAVLAAPRERQLARH